MCLCIYYLREFLVKCFCVCCPPVLRFFFSDCNQSYNLRCTSFCAGFLLGQAYYYYLLKNIPFPYNLGYYLSLVLSVLLVIQEQFRKPFMRPGLGNCGPGLIISASLQSLRPVCLGTVGALSIGIGNAVSIQVRCICLLIFPMYCGKAGRGVLKAVILTYVVAGPITNMGLNAREVVRVFACSTQLSFNLSKERYDVMVEPFKKTALSMQSELDQLKDTLRSIRDVVAPIEHEIEDTEEVEVKKEQNDNMDALLKLGSRSRYIINKYQKILAAKKEDYYLKLYEKKLEYRCQYQLTQAAAVCIKAFASAHDNCFKYMPEETALIICWPLKLNHICNFIDRFLKTDTCNSRKHMDGGLGEGYVALKKAKRELSNLNSVSLNYKVTFERNLHDVQDSKETGGRVLHSFEEKHIIMGVVFVALNVSLALLFLRIVMAALTYHEMYLTSITFDNVYITGYFKELDKKRKRRDQVTLLPLKKMERYKYIDIHSMWYTPSTNSKLVTQILKVMLEVVTATTFVMLDRLFYEALDVVRQHAQLEVVQQGTQDFNIEVEGTGVLASLLRKLISNLSSTQGAHHVVTNKECVPHPRAMPPIYFVKIYGGYLWILLLLYLNPYTVRLRRQICSYFYPHREKQRVLHLYNDILKKRMKMDKTLRRKAVQAVRAHYLSGENLLSLRMKFPYLLGWLHALPAARMTCLICGETEPRNDQGQQPSSRWHCCCLPKCPFVYCAECWKEAGARCLACDPSLNELSDVDSLSEDDQLRY